MAQFARHNLLCGFAALRELIFQTVHDSRDPVFDQIFLSHPVAPGKRDSRQAAKAQRGLRGRDCWGFANIQLLRILRKHRRSATPALYLERTTKGGNARPSGFVTITPTSAPNRCWSRSTIFPAGVRKAPVRRMGRDCFQFIS